MAERTEQATPRRRQEARKKGTVARSMDLNGSLTILAAIMVLPSVFHMFAEGFLHSLHQGLGHMPSTLDPSELGPHVANLLGANLPGLTLLLGTIMLVGVAANLGQVGFVLSGEALKPNFGRLNPANGLKRLFGLSSVVETGKASLKFFLFFLVVYQVFRARQQDILTISYLPPLAALALLGEILRTVATRIAMIWLVLAAMDYGYQRFRTNKDLKMTKDEVKREMKEQETSMETKMAQAKFRRRLRSGSLKQAVQKADVIVTNPTHFSVAIKYDLGKDHAPQVVAKGQDLLAFRIREFAKELDIPIVPNPPLARALYRQCEIGDFIPREYFQTVAEVLAYVYRTIKQIR